MPDGDSGPAAPALSGESSEDQRREFAVVGGAAALLTMLLVLTLTPGPVATFGDLALLVVWYGSLAVGFLATYLAWELGGFSKLQSLGFASTLRLLHRRLALSLYAAGRLAVTLDLLAGGLVVLLAAGTEPFPAERPVAVFSLASALGGLLLRAAVRRHDVTVAARISQLEVKIKILGREITQSSRKLAEVDEVIRDLDRQLAIRFEGLAGRRSVNEALSKALDADPAAVRAIQRPSGASARAGPDCSSFSCS